MEGIPNLGNTCWLNSLVQLLLNNSLFKAHLKRLKCDSGMTAALRAVAEKKNSAQNMHRLLLEFWVHYTPADSHEAFLHLLNRLHEENKVRECRPAENDTLTSQIFTHNSGFHSLSLALFQGVQMWETSDGETRYEPFTTFFLEPGVPGGRSYNMRDAFARTFRKRSILHMPLLLAVCFEKTDEVVDLLTHFTLGDTDGTEVVYEISGIVVHTGGKSGGHYFAICNVNAGWFLFDDNSVTPFSGQTSSLSGCTPRIILYTRRVNT
jgi:hypothetical protein